MPRTAPPFPSRPRPPATAGPLRIAGPLLLAVLLLVLLAAPGNAQEIRGRLVASGDTSGIAGADIAAVDTAGAVVTRAVTDTVGAFALRLPGAGAYRLRASRIGYEQVESGALRVAEGEQVVVRLAMATEAVPLRPLEVVLRRRAGTVPASVAERERRLEELGLGHIITRKQIEARHAVLATDLLRAVPMISVRQDSLDPGQQVVRLQVPQGECRPDIYVDGTRITGSLDQYVRPDDIEGIEVYRREAEAPSDYLSTNLCGVIIVWTRRGHGAGGRHMSWGRALIGLGLLGVLLLVLH